MSERRNRLAAALGLLLILLALLFGVAGGGLRRVFRNPCRQENPGDSLAREARPGKEAVRPRDSSTPTVEPAQAPPSAEPRLAGRVGVRTGRGPERGPAFEARPDSRNRLRLAPELPWKFLVEPDQPGELIYEWRLDGVPQPEDGPEFVWTPQPRDTGNHTLEVLVTDGDSESDSFAWETDVRIPLAVDMNDWGKVCAITIDSSKIDANLTNWTFIVTEQVLPPGMFDADGPHPALEGGGDLRFTSDAAGTNRLACDVRSFRIDNDPANGYAEIAVKVPAVSSGPDNTTIYLWYNKPGATQPAATDAYGQYNAYDSHYVGVWHDGGGNDRTINQNHGTAQNGITLGGETGAAGTATLFNGTGHKISVNNDGDFNFANGVSYTMSAITRTPGGTGATMVIVGTRNSADGGKGLGFLLDSNGFCKGYIRDINNTVTNWGSNHDVDDNNWHGVAITYEDNEEGKTFFDGGLSKLTNIAEVSHKNSAPTFTIGYHNIGASVWSYYKGVLDELRISRTRRRPEWIKADHLNLLDPTTFAQSAGFTTSASTVTVEEDGGTGAFTVVLDKQPAGNVVISVTSSAPGEATVSPATLTFTNANWDTPQTVTVTGIDDDTAGDDTATVTLSVDDAASDDAYDVVGDQAVSVTCIDELRENWGKVCAITIDSSKIDADLTNWTLIVTEGMLPPGMFDADGAHPALEGGGDLRFTSDAAGTLRLACDVRSFHIDNDPANGYAEIAVKVPLVTAATDTTIYLWYNRPGVTQPTADHAYGQYNAYASHYDFVSHDGGLTDRTGNQRHGTPNGGVNGGNATGQLREATYFDGTDDFFNYGYNPAYGKINISMLYQRKSTEGYAMGRYPNWNNTGSFRFGNTGAIIYGKDGAGAFGLGTGGSVAVDEYHWVTLRYTGGNIYLYYGRVSQ